MSDFLKQFEKGNYHNSSEQGVPAPKTSSETEQYIPIKRPAISTASDTNPKELIESFIERDSSVDRVTAPMGHTTAPAARETAPAARATTSTARATASGERTPSSMERTSTPDKRPTAPARQQAAIRGPAHETVIDRSYHSNKRLRIIVFALVALAVCTSGIFIFYLMNQVAVKPLVGVDLNEARSWALKNRIELNTTYEFSVEVNKDVVIKQSPEAGSKIQKGSVIDITVSKGPDPDEILRLPDFTTLSMTEARDWSNKNKATNVNIIQEYNSTVEAGRFIRKEFRSDWVTETNYARKDIMVLYYSRGPEPVVKDVTVPDFRGKFKADVDLWANANNIKVTFEEQASESVPQNGVISQSIGAGVKISKGDAITIVLSLGAGVTVPNFNRINMNTAAGAVPGLTVTVNTRYHASVPYGSVIYQSEPAGTVLYGANPAVTVIYSEGRPFIDDLIGRSERDLPQYFYSFQTKGADITYAVTYVDSHHPKGTVVYASRNSEFIEMKTTVWLEVSLGNLPPPVDPPSPPVTPDPPDPIDP